MAWFLTPASSDIGAPLVASEIAATAPPADIGLPSAPDETGAFPNSKQRCARAHVQLMSQPHLSAVFERSFLKVISGDAADVVYVTPGEGQKVVVHPGSHPGDTVRIDVIPVVSAKTGAA